MKGGSQKHMGSRHALWSQSLLPLAQNSWCTWPGSHREFNKGNGRVQEKDPTDALDQRPNSTWGMVCEGLILAPWSPSSSVESCTQQLGCLCGPRMHRGWRVRAVRELPYSQLPEAPHSVQCCWQQGVLQPPSHRAHGLPRLRGAVPGLSFWR